MIDLCPECGSKRILLRNGEYFCEECGLVINDDLIYR
jgi:transcription initiation factor TFIIIB Brf1 subunit/transcription initiation factor TFIIB